MVTLHSMYPHKKPEWVGFCYSDPRTLFQLITPLSAGLSLARLTPACPFVNPVLSVPGGYTEAHSWGLVSLFHWGDLGSGGVTPSNLVHPVYGRYLHFTGHFRFSLTSTGFDFCLQQSWCRP